MNRRLALRCLGLALLAIATSTATSLIVKARALKPTAHSNEQSSTEIAGPSVVSDDAAATIFQNRETGAFLAESAHTRANFNLALGHAYSGPNFVGVDARALMHDKRPNQSYIWVLRVYANGSDQLVSEKYYRNQVFSMADVAENTATFSDQVPVKPGNYRVSLSLYGSGGKLDLRTATLSDGDTDHTLLGWQGKVTVSK